MIHCSKAFLFWMLARPQFRNTFRGISIKDSVCSDSMNPSKVGCRGKVVERQLFFEIIRKWQLIVVDIENLFVGVT